jgi:hypothetical protein
MTALPHHGEDTTLGRSRLGVEMVASALDHKARLSAEFAGDRKIQVWDWYMMGMSFVLDEAVVKMVIDTAQKNW